jgi:transposase
MAVDRCAGIDWAKEVHRVCVLDGDGGPLVERRLAHDERDLDGLCELLVAHRRDLVLDQARAIVRLREALVSLFPGLERALDFKTLGPLVLVSRYQTPQSVRRAGRERIEAYLRCRGIRNASRLAETALRVAKAQRAVLPAEGVAAGIVRELAERALALKERTAELEREIEERFVAHPLSEVLVSLPGMGTILGAEFLAAVGDVTAFESAGQLAAYAGLVPASRDSGKRVGINRILGEAATRRSRWSSTGPPSPVCATTGREQGLLRPQEGGRQEAPPSRHCPRPSTGRRDVGHDTRRQEVRSRPSRLTNS